MSDHQCYNVEYDITTDTWDIYFENFDTGYRRFVSEHYDREEAQSTCAYRNSLILRRFERFEKGAKE